MRTPLLRYLLPVLLLAGCDSSDPQSSTVRAATDSAGVRIVTSDYENRVALNVLPSPELSLGGVDVEGPTSFGWVGEVVLTKNGRLWVSDDMASEIRVFDSTGSHLGTLGGAGDGPGEYRAPRLAGVTAAGTVVASDFRLGRIDRYDAELRLTESLGLEDGQGTFVVAAVGEMGLMVVENGHLLFSAEDREIVQVESEVALRVGAEMRRVPVGSFPGTDRVVLDGVSSPVPLTAGPGMAGGDAAYVAGPDAYEIRRYGIDGLEAIFRLDREPAAADAELLDRLRATWQERYSGSRLERRLELLSLDGLPNVLPTYSALVVGLDGTIWAGEWSAFSDTPVRWDLFGSSGEYLGHASMPDGFVLHAADSGVVAGVWRDEYDVHHVRVYRTRSTAPSR